MVQRLTVNDVGTFIVSTLSGTKYFMELDGEQSSFVTRFPEGNSDTFEIEPSVFRCDGERFPLHKFHSCELGFNANMWVSGVNKTRFTVTNWLSTPVTEIVSLEW